MPTLNEQTHRSPEIIVSCSTLIGEKFSYFDIDTGLLREILEKNLQKSHCQQSLEIYFGAGDVISTVQGTLGYYRRKTDSPSQENEHFVYINMDLCDGDTTGDESSDCQYVLLHELCHVIDELNFSESEEEIISTAEAIDRKQRSLLRSKNNRRKLFPAIFAANIAIDIFTNTPDTVKNSGYIVAFLGYIANRLYDRNFAQRLRKIEINSDKREKNAHKFAKNELPNSRFQELIFLARH